MSPRLPWFLLIAFAPLLVLTIRGSRARAAGWVAAVVGFVVGVLSLGVFVLLWGGTNWSVLAFFLFCGIHILMAAGEAMTVWLVQGGGQRRARGALFGAALGHAVWWFELNLVRPLDGELTLVFVLILIPAAALGAACSSILAAQAGEDPRSN